MDPVDLLEGVYKARGCQPMRREPTANVRECSDHTRDDDTDRCQSSQQARSAKCRRPLICRSFRVACQSDSPTDDNRCSSEPGPGRSDEIESTVTSTRGLSPISSMIPNENAISDSLYLARYFTGEPASSQSDEAVRVPRSTQTQRSYFSPFRLPSYLCVIPSEVEGPEPPLSIPEGGCGAPSFSLQPSPSNSPPS